MTTKKFGLAALLGTFSIIWGAGSPMKVEARPQYKEQFEKKYTGLAAEVVKVKCGVCHPPGAEEKKKARNNYGQALGKVLNAKNVTDKEAILKALITIEAQKSASEGKTFGDLIKAGTLPGNNE
jgi:hypothetical protein